MTETNNYIHQTISAEAELMDFTKRCGQRDKIFEAISESIRAFFTNINEPAKAMLTTGIEPLVRAIGVDQFGIYRLIDLRGEKRLGLIYRWVAPPRDEGRQVQPMYLIPQLPVTAIWMEMLRRGQAVHVNTGSCSPAAEEFLNAYQVKTLLVLPLLLKENLWGAVSLVDNCAERVIAEGSSDLLSTFAYLAAQTFVHSERKEASNKTLQALKRRNKLVRMINRRAIGFLAGRQETIGDILTTGIDQITGTLPVDRVYLYRRNYSRADVEYLCVFSWDKNTGGTETPVDVRQEKVYARILPWWDSIIKEGEVLNSPVVMMPEARELSAYGVEALAVVPVFVSNQYWGLAVYENCTSPTWYEDDIIDMMRTTAMLCANTLTLSGRNEAGNGNDFSYMQRSATAQID